MSDTDNTGNERVRLYERLTLIRDLTLHESGLWRVVVNGHVHWTPYRAVAEAWLLEADGELEPGTAERLQIVRDMVARTTIELQ